MKWVMWCEPWTGIKGTVQFFRNMPFSFFLRVMGKTHLNLLSVGTVELALSWKQVMKNTDDKIMISESGLIG